nr:pyruvate decarboxylase 2 [Tanacetum cinerariifolium]
KRIKKNTTAYENYHRIFVPEGHPLKSAPMEPLRVNVLFEHIQKMLSGDTAVIAETGDSWFNCQKLKLPEGCGGDPRRALQRDQELELHWLG